MMVYKKTGIIIFIVVLLIPSAACRDTATPSRQALSRTPESLPPTRTDLPASPSPEVQGTTLPAETSAVPQSAPSQASSSTPAYTSETVPFKEIAIINAGEGWAWGRTEDRKMRIWRTSDGARTWFEVSPPARVRDFAFALDALTAWAVVCPSPAGSYEPTLAKTEDGGQTWTVFPEPVKGTLATFRFSSQSRGIQTGYDVGAGNGFYTFYETSDGGRTWERVEILSSHQGESPGITGRYQACNLCGDLVYLDQERLMVLEGTLNVAPAAMISIWTSDDRGATWKSLELPLPSADQPAVFHPYQPTFFDDGSGILPYQLAGDADESSTMAFYASRNGLDWHLQSAVEDVGDVAHWNQFDFASRQDIYFACGSGLCASHDGGQNWNRLSTNLNFNTMGTFPTVSSFDFVDGQSGWSLVEENYEHFSLWKTADGGRTWEKINSDLYPE